MCEDAGCDFESGRVRENVSPELMEQVRDRLAKKAAARGMTLDEYVLETNTRNFNTLKKRDGFWNWLESFWVDLRLMTPGL